MNSIRRALLVCSAALALVACGSRQQNLEPSTSQAETEALVAAMENQPQIAAGELRKGPDTALLPAATGPAPAAHSGHGGDAHHQHR